MGQAIRHSLGLTSGVDTTVTAMQDLLAHAPAGTVFLFHIDKVGVLEATGSNKGDAKMLYKMWNDVHIVCHPPGVDHFYILSGRSKFLHWMGRQSSNFPCSALAG